MIFCHRSPTCLSRYSYLPCVSKWTEEKLSLLTSMHWHQQSVLLLTLFSCCLGPWGALKWDMKDLVCFLSFFHNWESVGYFEDQYIDTSIYTQLLMYVLKNLKSPVVWFFSKQLFQCLSSSEFGGRFPLWEYQVIISSNINKLLHYKSHESMM